MRYSFVFLFAMVGYEGLHAQSGPPKSKADIEAIQKQAKQSMDKLTPEQKAMMEQMGIKLPDPSALPTAAMGGQADFGTSATGGVPKKNTALIAAIPKATLTMPAVPAYIKSVNEYIDKKLTADDKSTGAKAYAALKTYQYDAPAMGNAAVGLWAIGQPSLVVYIMGKACTGIAADADLLSNFSAMLSMGGAPHQAIPLLELLNQTYPDNTTILNNLGQAWFCLGDTAKANTYLEKTVRLFAYHPQANYTQCLLLESQGKKAGAIEKMKRSMAYSYSLDKLNKLRQLGYSVKGKDMRAPYRPDTNPLGLRNFVRPAFPKNYEEEVLLKYEWDAFQQLATNKQQELNKQLQPYIVKATQQAQATYSKISGPNPVGLSATKAVPSRLYQQMAQRNLDEMNKDGGQGYRLKTAQKKVDSLVKQFMAEKDKLHQGFEKQYSIKETHASELGKKGENVGYDVCVVQRAFSDWVYKQYNGPLEEAYNNFLHQLRLKISEELYWRQFIDEEETFQAAQITAKKDWLAAVSGGRYLESAYITNNNVCPAPAPDQNKPVKLADFDDLHCKYISTLDFSFAKQSFSCGKARIEFDLGKLSGNLNFSSNNSGVYNFDKATIEVTAVNIGKTGNVGPLQVGANVKAGMGMEIGRNGIEDVYVTGEVSVKVGSNIISQMDEQITQSDKDHPTFGDIGVSDPSTGISASGRMSLVSGSTSGSIKGFGM